ncbi:MAG: hypothetical protein WC889_05760 [Myxococcota bacterium]
MTKRLRQEAILRLVRKQPVASQEALRVAIGRLGVQVTQATLSRDISELGLVKTPDGYCLPAQPGSGHGTDVELKRVLREFMNEAVPAGNLVAVKTPAGAAGALGCALDRAEFTDIVGTLAGDDIVLIITKSQAVAARVCRRLQELAG